MMIRDILLGTGALLVMATGQAQAVRPASVVSAKSVLGSVQTCKGIATECKVIVSAQPAPTGGGCIAAVDIETLRVKGKLNLNFTLVRSAMADKETYEFIGEGVLWTGTAPTANQFKFVALSPDRTVAGWYAGKDKTTEPDGLGYVPTVIRSRDKALCGAGDPKIANEGP